MSAQVPLSCGLLPLPPIVIEAKTYPGLPLFDSKDAGMLFVTPREKVQ
jgi:hypothetical protein